MYMPRTSGEGAPTPAPGSPMQEPGRQANPSRMGTFDRESTVQCSTGAADDGSAAEGDG
jgi:hypothetical protein